LGAAGDTDIPYLDDLKKLKNSKKTAKPAASAADDDNADRFISFKGSKRAPPPDAEEDDAGLLAMPMSSRFDDDDDGDDGSDDSDAMEADDYYANVAAASAAKKSAREEKRSEIQSQRESSRAAAYADMEQIEMDGGKRTIGREIMKNTGMSKKVQAKKAKDRNPRVKRKVKYQDALKRRKGAVQEIRDKSQKYGGEQTGIKTNVVRSVKLS
jgi:U3 small nucleolar RNA-associated protein 3